MVNNTHKSLFLTSLGLGHHVSSIVTTCTVKWVYRPWTSLTVAVEMMKVSLVKIWTIGKVLLVPTIAAFLSFVFVVIKPWSRLGGQ